MKDSVPPNRSREPLEFQVRAIAFLGEQDGPPERELKAALRVLFSDERGVSRAFLAKVTHDFAIPGVALCICLVDSDAKSSEALRDHLMQKIARAFAGIFASVEHLDVVFLSAAEEQEASRVCRPFYEV